MFNFRGDSNGRHNLPGEPMLQDLAAALFLVGISVALARSKKPALLAPATWSGDHAASGNPLA